MDLWGNVEIHSEVKKKRPKSRLSGLEITEEEKLGKRAMIKGIDWMLAVRSKLKLKGFCDHCSMKI